MRTLKLFDVKVDNLQDGDFEEFLKFLGENEKDDKDVDKAKSYKNVLKGLKPSVALRLLIFIGPNKRMYTILQPLWPLLLVWKADPDDYT